VGDQNKCAKNDVAPSKSTRPQKIGNSFYTCW